MNRIFTVILVAVALVLPTGVLYAAPLDAASPERSQLVAMGYEIQTSTPTDIWTIAKSENGNMVFSKTENSLLVARFFSVTRKDLTKEQQLELFTILNQINTDLSYQVSLGDGNITFAAYYTGPYNAKVFAYLVQSMEKADVIFDKYPAIYKLVNK